MRLFSNSTNTYRTRVNHQVVTPTYRTRVNHQVATPRRNTLTNMCCVITQVTVSCIRMKMDVLIVILLQSLPVGSLDSQNSDVQWTTCLLDVTPVCESNFFTNGEWKLNINCQYIELKRVDPDSRHTVIAASALLPDVTKNSASG
jgi:hypothetical protein